MKFLVILLSALAMSAAQDYIKTANDNLDASTLSIDQMRGIANCFIERGPCDSVSASYKQQYPLIMQNSCQRCSAVHKHGLRLFFNRFMNELPDEFAAFLRLYDPKGIYFNGFYKSFKDY